MDLPPPPAEGNVNKGIAMNAVTAIIVGLTAIVVALRFAVRIGITKILWWDDWTILFAIVKTRLSSEEKDIV